MGIRLLLDFLKSDSTTLEQTITKIENQSLFRISHFLVIFLSFLVNILHLRNSVFKRETLVKCYDPYIYMPRHGDVSAHAKERPRRAKKSSIFSQSSGMESQKSGGSLVVVYGGHVDTFP